MLALVVALYAMFGFTFSLAKLSVLFVSPFFNVGIRALISGSMLLGYVFWSKKTRCYPQRRDLFLYVQLTLFFVLVPYTLRLWALEYVSSVKMALLFNLNPFFAAIIAYCAKNERLSWAQIGGLLIGFIGTVPILLTGAASEDLAGSFWFISLPEAAVIAAAAAFSYGLFILQQLVKHRGCSLSLANGVSMFAGGWIALGLSTFSSQPIAPGNAWLYVGIVGLQILFSNIICSNLYAHLLKTYSVTFLAFASFLSPLFTIFYGNLLFGETVTWHFFASFGLIVFGLALYSKGHLTVHPEKVSPELIS